VLGGTTALAVSDSHIPLVLVALAVVGLIVALIVVSSPMLSAALLGLSIPEIQDVTGGHFGLHVAASDLLFVLIGGRLFVEATLQRRRPTALALRRVQVPVLQYVWIVVLLLVIHFGFTSAVKSAQRLELLYLPMLAGAFLVLRGQHMVALKAYVLSATVLAVAWSVDQHALTGQFQKNPVGGFIASAVLLLIAVPRLRRLLWCTPILLIGVGLTASRGAVLALAAGIVVIVLMQAATSRRGAALARILTLLLLGLVVFQFLPTTITTRLTNYTVSQRSRSSYALYIREEYDHDAEQLIAAHPLTGVGVGNYLAGSAALGTSTTDPHNVILLEAAEGGYLFAASFIVLIAGLAFALWRMRRVELAAAAAAVVVATFVHGLVDVYWVRGTPVLGFLLVGMVCALASQRKAEAAAA
jgi:hypothetical protein